MYLVAWLDRFSPRENYWTADFQRLLDDMTRRVSIAYQIPLEYLQMPPPGSADALRVLYGMEPRRRR